MKAGQCEIAPQQAVYGKRLHCALRCWSHHPRDGQGGLRAGLHCEHILLDSSRCCWSHGAWYEKAGKCYLYDHKMFRQARIRVWVACAEESFGVSWGGKLMGIYCVREESNAGENTPLNMDVASFHWVECCPDITSPLPTFLRSPLHFFTFFLFHKSLDVHKPSSCAC